MILQTLTNANSKPTKDNLSYWVCFGSLSSWEVRKWCCSLSYLYRLKSCVERKQFREILQHWLKTSRYRQELWTNVLLNTTIFKPDQNYHDALHILLDVCYIVLIWKRVCDRMCREGRGRLIRSRVIGSIILTAPSSLVITKSAVSGAQRKVGLKTPPGRPLTPW